MLIATMVMTIVAFFCGYYYATTKRYEQFGNTEQPQTTVIERVFEHREREEPEKEEDKKYNPYFQ